MSAHLAAEGGRGEALKVLLAAGVDVNAKDGDGITPAHLEAVRQHKEALKLLVAAGAVVNSEYDGLSLADKNKALRCSPQPRVPRLATSSSPAPTSTASTLESMAAPRCAGQRWGGTRPSWSTALLGAGASVDPRDNFAGCSPLYLAAWYGRAEAAAALLQAVRVDT